MKINIKPYHFTELLNKGYSLDMMYILELIQNQKDLDVLVEENKKIGDILTTLRRKQLVREDKDELTTKGQEVLAFLDTKVKNLTVKKVDNTDFNKWWSSYPGVDTFSYKGQSFQGARSLRVNKDKCRAVFEKIVLEGEYSSGELIKALEFQVEQIKERSVKERQNKLTYLQNSLTYLNQRVFEPFIELVKSDVQIERVVERTNGTDI